MMTHVWLLRHAKSDWGDASLTDFERPLNPRGRRDAPRLGRWLAATAGPPERVVASPARRVAETVDAVLSAAGWSELPVTWEPRIYEASVGELLDVLTEVSPGASSVWLVGHNPGLEELLRFLAPSVPMPADRKLMPTAALARLELSGRASRPQPGAARSASVMRPADLPPESGSPASA